MRSLHAHLRPIASALLPPLMLLAVGLRVTPAFGDERKPLVLELVDVGEGDAALITSPLGKTVLLDSGPRAAAPVLTSFVKARTRGPLDLVLLTHCHVDHFGAMAAVLEAVGARMFLVGPCPAESDAYHRLLQTVQRLGIRLLNATSGRRFDLGGGAVLVLLGPPTPPLTGTRSDANANSVVSRLQMGNTAMLLMGDAERATEKWLLSSGAELRADLLKVAHHGSRYTTSSGLLKAVRPWVAVISVGMPNDYGHPAAETLARLRKGGVQVYRTDQHGTVRAESDGKQIRIRTDRPVVGTQGEP